MNARYIKRRLHRLETALCPADDGTFTLEELCRAMWHVEKKHFLEMAREHRLGLLVTQFEGEDAEREKSVSRGRPSRGRFR